jgi:hypothetical protein
MSERLLRQYRPDSGSAVNTMAVHCSDSPVITLLAVANPFSWLFAETNVPTSAVCVGSTGL